MSRSAYAKQAPTEAFTREEILRFRENAPEPPAPIRGSFAAVVRKPDWMTLGACKDKGNALWFPSRGGNDAKKDTAQAKAICEGCPVRQRCLEYADSFHGREPLRGTWGGLTLKDRQARHAAQDATLPSHGTCMWCGGPITASGRYRFCSASCADTARDKRRR